MNLKIKRPKKKKAVLPEPPKASEPKITNLSKKGSNEFVTLNLRVTAELRREIKLYATSKDRSIVDVMIAAFGEYRQRHI